MLSASQLTKVSEYVLLLNKPGKRIFRKVFSYEGTKRKITRLPIFFSASYFTPTSLLDQIYQALTSWSRKYRSPILSAGNAEQTAYG